MTVQAPTFDIRLDSISPQQELVQKLLPEDLPTTRRIEQSPFETAFQAAMNVLNDTNSMMLQARDAQRDFATGRLDDILAVQMAESRASSALNFTVTITNKIIESYREIMRMQI